MPALGGVLQPSADDPQGEQKNAPIGSSGDEESKEPEYEVDKITDCKYNRKGVPTLFRVGWKNYPSSEDTWEPASSLTAPGVQELIKEYHQHFTNSPPPPPSKRRRTASRRSSPKLRHSI